MIELGGKKFKTKTTLTAYCKYMLNNVTPYEPVTCEWGKVIHDLFKMHYNYYGLTGGKVFEIKVQPCHINPRNRQFYIEREDGFESDFSYMKCITPKSQADRIKEILRMSVKDQTIAYKDEYFGKHMDSKGFVICPETKLKIKRKDSHIDHYPLQFNDIVSDWFSENQLTFNNVHVQAGEFSWEFVDKALAESFCAYHKEKATYRIVLDKVNQQRKRPKRFVEDKILEVHE